MRLMRFNLLFLVTVLVWPMPLFAAELRVSNRDPVSGEVGYRPADGETVALNPPSFIWLHENSAKTYDVQWASGENFEGAATVEGFVWNTYTHHEPLKPGTYSWRYRFKDASGAVSEWSVARKVVVPETAVAFPMPTRVQQRDRVPKDHPRLFVRPEDLPKLRELAKGKEAEAFERLKRTADKYIAAGPTAEPEKMGSAVDKNNAELVKYWWPNREQTMRACQEAEIIAFTYMLTREEKYKEAARKWVMHLAAWNPDGPTNFKMNCEAAKPLLYRLPRAYDWAFDALTDEDRAIVRAVMARRIHDAWISGEVGRGTGHLTKPYGSHANRIWHKIGEAGISFLGEVPEAETWLDYAVNKFYACYPVWSDDDGGWHEGVSYWNGYMSKVVWWLQVADKALAIDGLKKPFFAHVGDFPMYVAPPNSPNMGFGDLSFRPVPRSVGRFMEYFIRAKGASADGGNAAYWRWWCDEWDAQGENDPVLGFLYRASLPAAPAAKAPSDLPQSKVFHGIGVAALNSTLLDAQEGVQVLFKSSPFGTQSHGHNAHNTFQVNAYGEALLTACTYRDLHGSKFHYQYVHSTAAQNGVLVDGKGQIPHTPAPHGKIIAEKLTKEWDWVVGDATAAYGGRLKRYHRHVVLLKPDVVVIFDDLVATEPATFQFMLHGLKNFAVDDAQARLSLEMPKAGVEVQYLSFWPLKFRQWDGFDPKPSREFPNQWHVEAAIVEKKPDARVATVIVPHRDGQNRAWTAEGWERDGYYGVRIVRDGHKTIVWFPLPKGDGRELDERALEIESSR